MGIDLTKLLGRKLPPSSDLFRFENPGDELVFIFRSRRIVEKDGRRSDLVVCEVLGGTKVDPRSKETNSVKPGKMSFFLQTDSRRIFDREKPIDGDQWHLQLVAIRGDLRGMKQYGYEILAKV